MSQELSAAYIDLQACEPVQRSEDFKQSTVGVQKLSGVHVDVGFRARSGTVVCCRAEIERNIDFSRRLHVRAEDVDVQIGDPESVVDQIGVGIEMFCDVRPEQEPDNRGFVLPLMVYKLLRQIANADNAFCSVAGFCYFKRRFI